MQFVLVALLGFAMLSMIAAQHTTLTLTWFKHGTNCTVPTGAPPSTYKMNVCSGVTKFMDGTNNAVFEYYYEDYGTCKVPCTDGNNLNCQWGLYYPYYLNVCNTNRCTRDAYGKYTCGDDPFPVAT